MRNLRKILVIDDDEAILDGISLMLESEGYKVNTTPKGEETYQKVAYFKPDVILLDVLMSGSDGREICKNLKGSDKTKNIPIIMISAHPSAGNSSIQFGADDFLAKPFESKELLQRIKKFNKQQG
jgi:DNA-binding response OmpR family regulator